MADLRMLAERLRNDGYWTGALNEASAGILALLDENERLRKALAWIDSADPEIIAAAEEKFGFKLFPAHP